MTAAPTELEQSVIGAVLLRADTLALLPAVEPGDFAGGYARAIWETIRNLESKNLPIDTTTIGDELVRSREFRHDGESLHERESAAAGIWAYLAECAARVPTAENAVEYARRVKDYGLRRRLLETLAEVIGEAKAGERTGAELLTMALAGISTLDAEQPEGASSIGDVVRRRLAQLEQIADEKLRGVRMLNGFPSGIAVLDEKLGGWQPGIVSIIAARPGMGKSSLGLATADACSAKGFGVHVFSLEDTESAYADRTLARTSGVAAEVLRSTQLSRNAVDNLQVAVTDLKRRPGWLFDDRSGISAGEIVRSVRRRRRANATRVVIVDYVQLVARPPRATAHEALTEAVTAFADAAKQDQIAYVVMSQLNRKVEEREDKRPQLGDLRESGSLEERAKCVVGVYRGSAYGEKPKRGIDFPRDGSEPSPQDFERAVQLLVLKNSNGRTGTIRATWTGATTRME